MDVRAAFGRHTNGARNRARNARQLPWAEMATAPTTARPLAVNEPRAQACVFDTANLADADIGVAT